MGRWAIPKATVRTLRTGDAGVTVWSLQKALNTFNTDVALDGQFGPATEASVRTFQGAAGLTADGIAGPLTQAALAKRLLDAVDTGLPPRLLEGFALMEGGNLLGAVNWSVAGGVDVGVLQRRVYEADYGDDAVIERAFNVAYQARLLSGRLIELRSIFQPRAGTQDGHAGMPAREKAWRLAALAHNWPSGADILSRTPVRSLSSYWTRPATWVTVHRLVFPDGAKVETPLHWAARYAGVLGDYHGSKGAVTGLVSSWP